MNKVCTACGAGIVAPTKPENDAELCSHCAGVESKPDEGAQDESHDHASV